MDGGSTTSIENSSHEPRSEQLALDSLGARSLASDTLTGTLAHPQLRFPQPPLVTNNLYSQAAGEPR